MNEIRDALLRMVKATRFLKKMSKAYAVIGWDENPHHEMYGDMMDAIYYLIGEHVNEFDKSVTWLAINAPYLTDERRTELLMSEYLKNNPNAHIEQPRPSFISPKELRKMMEDSGGYMAPEGDWQ